MRNQKSEVKSQESHAARAGRAALDDAGTQQQGSHRARISERTHLGHLFRKLGVTSRTEAVKVATHRGLVRLE